MTGKVTGEKEDIIPGVTVAVKGTQQGGLTEPDGKYPGSGSVEAGFSSKATQFTKAGTWNMYVNREPRFYVGAIRQRVQEWRGHWS